MTETSTRRRRVRGVSPSMVIACLALLVSLGGTSIAAVTLVPRNSVGTPQLKNHAVTSKKVKNGSLLAADFRAGQLPAGPAGPQGLAGPQGKTGPSDAYFVDPVPNVIALNPSAASVVGELAIPAAGHYVIWVKGILTATFASADIGGLFQCNVATKEAPFATIDQDPIVGLPAGTLHYSWTLLGAHTFAAPQTLISRCIISDPTNARISGVRIAAIKVGNLTVTP